MVWKYVEFTRYREWASALLITAAGIFAGSNFSLSFDILAAAAVVLALCLVWSFGFSINSCFDAEADRMKKGNKNPVSSGIIKKSSGLIFSVSLLILGFLITYRFVPQVAYIYAITAACLFVYSSPPLRLKGVFPMDLVLHGLFGSLSFLLAYAAFSAMDYTAATMFFVVFIVGVISELLQEIRDYEPDKKSGLKTAATVLGVKNSLALLKSIFVIAAVISTVFALKTRPEYGPAIVAGSLPFLHFLFTKKYRNGKVFFEESYKNINLGAKAFILLALAAFVLSQL